MHSLEVIYRNGFFYRKEGNKRVSFKNDQEYTIVSMHNDTISDVAAEVKIAARSSDDLINEIQSKKDVSWFHKILSKGSILNFNIKVEGLVIFKVLLEEDQYIIKKTSHQRVDPILYPCKAT
jgi:ribosomal protein L15